MSRTSFYHYRHLHDYFHDEALAAMSEPILTFKFFPKLPRELQIKIWSHSLEVPCVTPRIVQVNYHPTRNSFSYSFTVPPALQVCHVSRLVALKIYLSLVPDSSHPVYFNPAVDSMYCKSPLDVMSDNTGDRLTLPFIDPQTNVSAVRFLVLHHEYLEYRSATNAMCPIVELRKFRKLETIFIVVPPDERLAERNWGLILLHWVRLPHSGLPELTNPYKLYAREPGPVIPTEEVDIPGFREYKGLKRQEAHWIEHTIFQCFGWQENSPEGFAGIVNRPWLFDEYWTRCVLPSIKHVRISA